MGLARGDVRFASYSTGWVTEFSHERLRLQKIFQSGTTIEHVGSTAVPDLAAKPIIDMLVGLGSLAEFEQYRPQLEALGYVSMPERERDWEIFIPKGPDDARTHYLHVMVKGSPEYEKVLQFRDYLRAHTDARDEYQRLKLSLAAKFANDRKSYTAAKAAFIANIVDKASQS